MPGERAKRAASLRKAYYAGLALRSAPVAFAKGCGVMNINELTAAERVVADLPHHCTGCTNRWNGYNACRVDQRAARAARVQCGISLARIQCAVGDRGRPREARHGSTG